jgi:hypothetical protein
MHAPTAIVPSAEIAARCCRWLQAEPRPAGRRCWLGGPAVAEARAGLPCRRRAGYDTPEQAVQACAMLATYRRNQEQLMQAPPACARAHRRGDRRCRRACANWSTPCSPRAATMLTEPEAKALLPPAACRWWPRAGGRLRQRRRRARGTGDRLPGRAEDPRAEISTRATSAASRCAGRRRRREATRRRDARPRRPRSGPTRSVRASRCRPWCAGRRRSS